jgi:hypothetical protein
MIWRCCAWVAIGLSVACGAATTKPPVANTPTAAQAHPKPMAVLLADAGWQERYADAKVREVDAQTFAIDTGTEQLTLTTGPDAAKPFDAYLEGVIAARLRIEQSTREMNGEGSWEIVGSRDGVSLGATRIVGAEGPMLCRFEIDAAAGWITPLGLCKYVLGIVAA